MTPTNTSSPADQEREKFEAAMRDIGVEPTLWMPGQPQVGYDDSRVNDYLLGWQLGRRASHPPVEPSDAVRGALVELVALKDLKERADRINPFEPGCEKEVLNDEYRRRQPRAWANARAALALQPAPELAVSAHLGGVAAVPSQAANWKPEPPCWLVERREDGRTTGYLGHAFGSFDWMATPDEATRFVRKEDANGVAECMEITDVIVAEHIWV